MTHASIPSDLRSKLAMPDHVERLSCGVEDGEDLIAGPVTGPRLKWSDAPTTPIPEVRVVAGFSSALRVAVHAGSGRVQLPGT